MDVQPIKELVDSVCRMALLIPMEDADALVREMDRTQSLMPLIDPTGYLKIAGNIPGHERAARAFLAFRQELSEATNEEIHAT